MLIKCLDILGMAALLLRSDKACPHTAQQVELDVMPVVQAMASGLRGCIEHLEHSTPAGREAYEFARDALAAYEGKPFSPTTEQRSTTA